MPRSAGRGTADKQGPGAARTAARASFRADVRCLCSPQVGGAEPRPRLCPALAWASSRPLAASSTSLPSWVLGSWRARPQGNLRTGRQWPPRSAGPGRGRHGHRASQHSQEGPRPRRPSPAPSRPRSEPWVGEGVSGGRPTARGSEGPQGDAVQPFSRKCIPLSTAWGRTPRWPSRPAPGSSSLAQDMGTTRCPALGPHQQYIHTA